MIVDCKKLSATKNDWLVALAVAVVAALLMVLLPAVLEASPF